MVVAENSEELFNFLVDSFHFTVRLGVKGNGEGLTDFELFPCFSHDLECELGASVQDDLLEKAHSLPDMIEIELGGLFCRDGFLTQCDDDGFAEVINDYKH